MQLKRKTENQEIETMFERVAPGEAKRLEARKMELFKNSINKEMLEYLYVRYTVNANAPFSHVEHPDFRTMLQYINPATNSLLPDSHNIIRSQFMDLFTEGRRPISLMLQSAPSSIYITCDAWTTPNHLSAWGIVGHFTSEDGSLHDLLLSLSEQEGSHSGYNQAKFVVKMLTSYNIRN